MLLENDIALPSQDDDVVIKVEHVSKKFSKSLKRSMIYGMKDITRNIFGRSSSSDKLRKGEFWAVNDVSFEVRKGEAIGIIGPNGAGKTTLLSLLNGIYMPDKGKITIKGKTSALIALGAGFHPMLTGRENIYVNGAVLGMSKAEIDKKFDAIVDFAELGDFLDMPVKNYSSGMFVRLGFAIAIHCEPEILLVDEVLAVGDLNFKSKCYKQLDAIRKSGATFLLVTHSIRQVERLCDRAILMDQGVIVKEGTPEEVVQKYLRFSQERYIDSRTQTFSKFDITKSSGELRVTTVRILDAQRRDTQTVQTLQDLTIRIEFEVYEDVQPKFGVAFITVENLKVFSVAMTKEDHPTTYKPGRYAVEVIIPRMNLFPGIYYINLKIRDVSDHVIQNIQGAVKIHVLLGDNNIHMWAGSTGFTIVDRIWRFPTDGDPLLEKERQ